MKFLLYIKRLIGLALLGFIIFIVVGDLFYEFIKLEDTFGGIRMLWVALFFGAVSAKLGLFNFLFSDKEWKEIKKGGGFLYLIAYITILTLFYFQIISITNRVCSSETPIIIRAQVLYTSIGNSYRISKYYIHFKSSTENDWLEVSYFDWKLIKTNDIVEIKVKPGFFGVPCLIGYSR